MKQIKKSNDVKTKVANQKSRSAYKTALSMAKLFCDTIIFGQEF